MGTTRSTRRKISPNDMISYQLLGYFFSISAIRFSCKMSSKHPGVELAYTALIVNEEREKFLVACPLHHILFLFVRVLFGVVVISLKSLSFQRSLLIF